MYGFTAAELGVGKFTGTIAVAKKADIRKARKAKKSAVATNAPKYKDDQGKIWSGRGPRPGWFKAALEAGKSAEDLLAK